MVAAAQQRVEAEISRRQQVNRWLEK